MDTELDTLLDASTPSLAETEATREALSTATAELVAAVTSGTQIPARARGRRRVALAGITAVALLGGGVAAAAQGGWLAPWADDPDGALTFTLPSGGTCEQRIGNIKGSDDQAQSMIHRWLEEHTLAEVADVDRALRELRANEGTAVRADGTEIAVGYGTAYYDEDHEYYQAVEHAIVRAIADKLKTEGFNSPSLYFDLQGEVLCEGARPDPSLPWWLS
ncbi:hypothetical protein GA707_19300 [Nostocoides sp. F2B08]|uniref:hypothetical protein n=1 Tax=Nostocoides sp. F2B08 TaxID=2653936 RepID=UPI001263D974|nr:hypothetical protein [Tetrasphaera sp. F2B08]KAB7740642.1 hypothetical protein GA707_19300 [Tetrasphaera sp. F2B08]